VNTEQTPAGYVVVSRHGIHGRSKSRPDMQLVAVQLGDVDKLHVRATKSCMFRQLVD